METVDKQTFDQFVREHNLIPDGFKANGQFTKTRWMKGDEEYARSSTDQQGTIYEIRQLTPA